MNKRTMTIIIIALTIIIAGAVGYLVLRPKKPAPTQPDQSQTTQPETPAETTPQPTTNPATEQPTQPGKGTYVAYDPAAISATAGRKILFFHAAWCPQCRALEKSILDGSIPQDVTIFKVNYDTATDLRQKYQVTLQTTLVEVDSQANGVKSFVAYDKPTLQAIIDEFKL